MIDTSSPVHPTGVEHGANTGVVGMTLLQYYAGQALAGLCADMVNAPPTYYGIVNTSFTLAEQMIATYNQRYGGKND
jgi:hypothetical protein